MDMDNRNALAKLIESMSDMDLQQMLAYAVGYEAGKNSQSVIPKEKQSRIPSMQEA